jgi:oligopeptidase B
VLPRVHEVEYDLTHHDDSFFIRTNDGAKTFRLVEAPVEDPSRPNWKEILAKRDTVTVESVNALRDYLVVEERDRGLIKLRIQDFASGETHFVDFPEPVYSAALGL